MCKLLQFFRGRNNPSPTPTPVEPTPTIPPAPVDPIPDPPVDTPSQNPVEPTPPPTPVEPTPTPVPTPVDPIPVDPTPLVNYPLKTSQVPELGLDNGTNYVITAADVNEHMMTLDYNLVADEHGMHGSVLREFNDDIDYRQGETIYIPSVEELCFFEYCRFYEELAVAKREYQAMPAQPNKELLRSARYRASGKIGKGYGTNSVVFYSRNHHLIGASERRSEVINGHKEYRVNWGENLWKCNIFMHDCVYQSRYIPDVMSNDHYITAGSLHHSRRYEQITIEEITPGCIAQLFNGSASNESHNMVLTSFVHRKALDNNIERWTFRALGAEMERAAVSFRQHFVSMSLAGDYYKVDNELDYSGREYIRFFRPLDRMNLV